MIIKQINAKDTYPLRIEILRKGIAKNYTFKEDSHKTSLHLGAINKQQIIGILSLIKNNHPYFNHQNCYQLRGMAVSKKFQKQGIGKLLIKKSLDTVSKITINTIWCNARENAIGFYLKMGFQTKGKPFTIEDIGVHYVMYINI